MSQIVLDEHLSRTEVLDRLQKWITATKIENLAPDETLKEIVFSGFCGTKNSRRS